MLSIVNLPKRFFSLYSVLCSDIKTLTRLNYSHLRSFNGQPTLCNGVQRNSFILSNVSPTVLMVKWKSTRKKKKLYSKKEEEEDDDDDEEENVDEDEDEDCENSLGKGVEQKTYKMVSPRIDSLLKIASGSSRKKIEEYFYDKKIWLNGKLLIKKATNVKINDEIDIIKSASSENPNFITVQRFEILNIKLSKEEDNLFLVKIRKTKSLLIENYEGNNYVQEN